MLNADVGGIAGTNPDTNTGESTAQSPQQCWFLWRNTDVGDKQRKYNANTGTSNKGTNTDKNKLI